MPPEAYTQIPGVYLPTNQGVVTWHYAPIIIVLRKCRVKKASSLCVSTGIRRNAKI
jgi:hypothetical protein